jgi:hypothetical protein
VQFWLAYQWAQETGRSDLRGLDLRPVETRVNGALGV